MRHFLILFSAFLVFSRVNSEKDSNDILLDFKHANSEELLKWVPPPQFTKEHPYYLSGFDDDGVPIWVTELGRWDTRKSAEGGPEQVQNYKKYILQMYARYNDSMKIKSTKENPVTEFNLIFDMDGFSLWQTGSAAAISLMLWNARQAEQAFTEGAKHCYIINSNFVFTSMWNLIRPLLGRFVYKVDMFGTNRHQWVPLLLKAFPKDQLPEWYGGDKDHKPVHVYG